MVEWPDSFDKWSVPITRVQFNHALTTGRIDLGHLIYLALELERFLGIKGSSDPSTIEGRLRAIEALLGLASPAVASYTDVAAPTAVMPDEAILWHEDQYQAGFIGAVPLAGFDVMFRYKHSALYDADGDYEAGARGYKWNADESVWVNEEIGILRQPDRMSLLPAENYVAVEWWTKGTIGTSTYPRTATVELGAVSTAGMLYTWTTPWPHAWYPAGGDYSLKDVLAYDADGGEVEVIVVKMFNSVFVKPVVDTVRVVLEAIGYTQPGEGEVDEFMDVRDEYGDLVHDRDGVVVRVRRW